MCLYIYILVLEDDSENQFCGFYILIIEYFMGLRIKLVKSDILLSYLFLIIKYLPKFKMVQGISKAPIPCDWFKTTGKNTEDVWCSNGDWTSIIEIWSILVGESIRCLQAHQDPLDSYIIHLSLSIKTHVGLPYSYTQLRLTCPSISLV